MNSGTLRHLTREAEYKTLGGILHGWQPAERIDADIFSDPKCRAVLLVTQRLKDQGNVVNRETVTHELARTEVLENVGGIEFLQMLEQIVPADAGTIQYNLQILQEAAADRRKDDLAERFRTLSEDGLNDTTAALIPPLLEQWMSTGAEAKGRRLRVLSGHELMATPGEAVREVVHGILPFPKQGSIYGGPGVGKSMLLRHLIAAVASGAEALGRYSTDEGPVLLVTAEEGLDDIRRGVMIVCQGAGYELCRVLDNLHVISVRDTEFALADVADRRWLEERIQSIRPLVVVLDSAASLSGVDMKDDQVVLTIMRWGGKVSSAFDTTVIWIAHDRKSKKGEAKGDTNDLDDLFGSRQVSAQLDFAYRLLPASGDDVRLRCTKMRVGVRPADIYLEVTTQQDRLHSMRAKSLQEGMSRMSQENEIVEAVQTHLQGGGGASMSQTRDMVAKALARRPADVAVVVHELIAKGFVRNNGTANRFDLEWVGNSMSHMSQRVPDTTAGQHVPVSHPLKGGTRDMGHAPADIEALLEGVDDAA